MIKANEKQAARREGAAELWAQAEEKPAAPSRASSVSGQACGEPARSRRRRASPGEEASRWRAARKEGKDKAKAKLVGRG